MTTTREDHDIGALDDADLNSVHGGADNVHLAVTQTVWRWLCGNFPETPGLCHVDVPK